MSRLVFIILAVTFQLLPWSFASAQYYGKTLLRSFFGLPMYFGAKKFKNLIRSLLSPCYYIEDK